MIEGSGDTIYFGWERGVHLREHRNCISNSAYRATEEILARCRRRQMYRAKSLGKARYEVFDADMRASVMDRLSWRPISVARSNAENFAISINDCALVSGEIAGFEALLRWQHPTRRTARTD